MFRSVAFAAAVLPAALLTTVPGAFASGANTITVQATVTSSGPHGVVIKGSQNGKPFGTIKLKKCGEDSATSYFCSGKGTVPGEVTNAKVRFEWKCPVNESCADHGTGTIINHGSTLALVKVQASPVKATKKGSTYTIKLEPVGE